MQRLLLKALEILALNELQDVQNKVGWDDIMQVTRYCEECERKPLKSWGAFDSQFCIQDENRTLLERTSPNHGAGIPCL